MSKTRRPIDYLNLREEHGQEIREAINDLLQHMQDRAEWLNNPNVYKLGGNQHWYRNVYLRSEHWRITRNEEIRMAKHLCQGCGVSDDISSLDVHHLSYEHLGYEQPGELIVLCRKCHEGMHL